MSVIVTRDERHITVTVGRIVVQSIDSSDRPVTVKLPDLGEYSTDVTVLEIVDDQSNILYDYHHNCSCVDDYKLRVSVDYIKRYGNLEKLILRGVQLTDGCLTDVVSSAKSVELYAVTGLECTLEQLVAVLDSKVESLHLYLTDIKGKSTDLSRLTALKSLVIRYCPFLEVSLSALQIGTLDSLEVCHVADHKSKDTMDHHLGVDI